MNTILVRTYSHSTYEIDLRQGMIRRLVSTHQPTKRQELDGNWKRYVNISNVEVGKSLIIVWQRLSEKNGVLKRATITSPITSFILDSKNLDS